MLPTRLRPKYLARLFPELSQVHRPLDSCESQPLHMLHAAGDHRIGTNICAMKEWPRNLSQHLFTNNFRFTNVVANSNYRNRARPSGD